MKNKIILKVYKATNSLGIKVSRLSSFRGITTHRLTKSFIVKVRKINTIKVSTFLTNSILRININQIPSNLQVSAVRVNKPLKIKCYIIPEDVKHLILNASNKKFVLKNNIYLKVKKNGILL